MDDDQFTKLFKYIEEFRADVDKRFDAQDRRIDDIVGAIAELSAYQTRCAIIIMK